MQRRTDIAIDPPDGDGNEANGHQVALEGVSEITVTVTSADGSRERVYRVAFTQAVAEIALDTGWNTFAWPGGDGAAIADALRGDGDLANDISAAVAALYGWDGEAGAWLAFFPALGDVPGVNTLATLEQGRAYWIAVTEPVTWTRPRADHGRGGRGRGHGAGDRLRGNRHRSRRRGGRGPPRGGLRGRHALQRRRARRDLPRA